jgi:hypothetical protein
MGTYSRMCWREMLITRGAIMNKLLFLPAPGAGWVHLEGVGNSWVATIHLATAGRRWGLTSPAIRPHRGRIRTSGARHRLSPLPGEPGAHFDVCLTDIPPNARCWTSPFWSCEIGQVMCRIGGVAEVGDVGHHHVGNPLVVVVRLNGQHWTDGGAVSDPNRSRCPARAWCTCSGMVALSVPSGACPGSENGKGLIGRRIE